MLPSDYQWKIQANSVFKHQNNCLICMLLLNTVYNILWWSLLMCIVAVKYMLKTLQHQQKSLVEPLVCRFISNSASSPTYISFLNIFFLQYVNFNQGIVSSYQLSTSDLLNTQNPTESSLLGLNTKPLSKRLYAIFTS